MATFNNIVKAHGGNVIQRRYAKQYAPNFDPIADSIDTILVVDTQYCLPLRALAEYFPNATIYGLKVRENPYQNVKTETTFEGNDRVVEMNLSANNQPQIQRLINSMGAQIDMVFINGGSMNAGLKTKLNWLWSRVSSSCIFCVENLGMKYDTEIHWLWKYRGKGGLKKGYQRTKHIVGGVDQVRAWLKPLVVQIDRLCEYRTLAVKEWLWVFKKGTMGGQ